MMRIKTYNEYINELWSKGVERHMSGEKRLEDKFNKMDLDLFNQTVDSFIREYDLKDVLDYLSEKFDEIYNEFLNDYGMKHGILNIRFQNPAKIPIPDFDYTFNIEKIKNVRVHVSYTHTDKDINVSCGNDTDEFDMSKTLFGQYIKNLLNGELEMLIVQNKNLLVKNIEINWNTFEFMLRDIIYNSVYPFLQNDYKSHATILPLYSYVEGVDVTCMGTQFDDFYFGGVVWKQGKRSSPAHVYVGDEMDIIYTDDDLAYKIVDVYINAFEQAKKDAEKNTI